MLHFSIENFSLNHQTASQERKKMVETDGWDGYEMSSQQSELTAEKNI
jgi:hypothetical protein